MAERLDPIVISLQLETERLQAQMTAVTGQVEKMANNISSQSAKVDGLGKSFGLKLKGDDDRIQTFSHVLPPSSLKSVREQLICSLRNLLASRYQVRIVYTRSPRWKT